MDNNVITAGVKPGGLTNSYEVKVLICYILNEIQKDLTFDELNAILQEEAIVNYFEYAQAVSSLVTTGHMVTARTENGEEAFLLTDIGIKTAQGFVNDIPRAIREKTIKNAREYLAKKRLEKENKVEVKKTEDGYEVFLKITDIGTDLLNLSLFVPTLEQGNLIKERFLKDPTFLYRGVVALLTGDKETVNSILFAAGQED